ncbi:MAG: NAD(P)-binding protein [Planctomycetota bacterium]
MNNLQWFDVIVTPVLALLLALVVLHRKSSFLRNVWRLYRAWLGWIVPALVFIVLADGFATIVWMTPPTQNGTPSQLGEVASGLVNAVLLLRLDGDARVDGALGQFGVGCSILLWTILAVEINRKLFYDALQAGRMGRLRNHVVVCGLGSIGMQLVRDLATNRDRKLNVVVVELDESNPYLDEARELHALVLIRDATEADTLRKAGVEHAAELFAVTGADNRNSAIVAHAFGLDATKRKQGRLKCFAHIENNELFSASRVLDDVRSASLPSKHAEGRSFSKRPVVEFVLPEEIAATQLVIGPLRQALPRELGRRVPHVVVFGSGAQGQALAREVAELVHLRNLKRSRLTLLVDDPIGAKRFRSAFPAFGPDLTQWHDAHENAWNLPAEADRWEGPFHAADHLRFPEGVTEGAPGVSFACNANFIDLPDDPVDDEVIQGIRYLLHRADCLPMVVVCTDSENRNALIAERLRDRLAPLHEWPEDHPWSEDGLPVFVCLPEQTVLHDMMRVWNQSQAQKRCRLIPFAHTREILGYDAIVSSGQRELAKWLASRFANEVEPEAYWDGLRGWERRSNMAAAAHAPFKGDILGIDLDLSKVPTAASLHASVAPTLVECAFKYGDQMIAAQAEHNRWIAERLMAGWRYADKPPLPPHDPTDAAQVDDATRQRKKLQDQRKERDSLVPWQHLDGDETPKDFAQKDDLLEAFQLKPVVQRQDD